MAAAEGSTSAQARILVLHTPGSPELKILERLPEGAAIIGVGRSLEDLQKGRRCPMLPSLQVGHACMHASYSDGRPMIPDSGECACQCKPSESTGCS